MFFSIVYLINSRYETSALEIYRYWHVRSSSAGETQSNIYMRIWTVASRVMIIVNKKWRHWQKTFTSIVLPRRTVRSLYLQAPEKKKTREKREAGRKMGEDKRKGEKEWLILVEATGKKKKRKRDRREKRELRREMRKEKQRRTERECARNIHTGK